METYQVTTWGKKANTYEFTAPSGQKCLLKRPQIQELLAVGMLDDIDELTQIAAKTIGDIEKPGADQKVPDEMKDPEVLRKVFASVDKIVQFVVVQPKILSNPEGDPEEWEAQNGCAYIGWIDLADKVAIVGEVTRPLTEMAPFPGGPEAVLGSVEPIEVVPRPAKRPAKNRR